MVDLSVFQNIEENLGTLEIDQIKQQLKHLITGMAVESPIFDPGAFLYRARKIGPTFNKNIGIKYADLIYPPKHLSKSGRLNRDGEPVLYCSMCKESVFFEIQDLHAGDELILTFWQTTEKMFVNNIGYTQYIFEKLGARRPCPQWRSLNTQPGDSKATISLPQMTRQDVVAALSRDKNSELRNALSHYFMSPVGPTETYKYRLTTAIGELHLGTIANLNQQFAGILYPSVRMWANGDNLALLPWFADRHIRFKKASHIRIDSREDTRFSVTCLDSANEFGENKKLIWLGRVPNWALQPDQGAKFSVVTGPDPDGDYQASLDGTVCHWVVVDTVTGQIIEPH